MKLSDLFPDHDVPSCAINGASMNSREITNGSLFFAVPGHTQDGTKFIPDAIERGAVAIVANKNKRDDVLKIMADIPANYPVVYVEDTRAALASVAARLYPCQPENIAAVTGTSGKSSTVWFVRQILESIGEKAASLGTIGLHAGDVFEKSALTTADPITLHKTLETLAKKNINYVAMEASSIGIEQMRMDGVRLKVAAFTNLSHEHLDYHATMDDYFKAKQDLFTRCLKSQGVAVLNTDISEYKRLHDVCTHHGYTIVPYGTHAEGKHAIRLVNRSVTPRGQNLVVSLNGQMLECHLPLIGAFQAQNVLCALAMVYSLCDLGDNKTLDIKALEHALSTLRTVPGRLERIDGHPEEASVYVDYAHKPGALKAVLDAVRPHTKGKLWVVFGCGGDRDRAKRQQMAHIAHDLADEIVITDDNPRSETPADIRAEITAGFPSFKNIGDRRKAIDFAMKSLQLGDSLIIAGKGHESGQTIHTQTLPFDDRDEARKSIKTLISDDEDKK